MKRFPRSLGVWSVVLVGILVGGCGPKSPEDKIAKMRSLYSARLNGFILEEEPVVAAVPEVPELEAVEIIDDGTVDGVDPEAVEMEPVVVEVEEKVRLDILIQHRSDENLPGITVDISMVDTAEVEKGHWRVWFDTSNVTQATVTQFTHILEDVEYEEGDGFFVEVRHPVPVEERGEYREFSQTP